MSKCIAILLIFFSIFFMSCINGNIDTPDNLVSFSISSPQNNWTFYTNEEIVFSTNLKNGSVMWYSSIDGDIGSGNNVSKLLTCGTHIITAKSDNFEQKITIVVKDKDIDLYETYDFIINGMSRNIILPSGVYAPAIISTDGAVNNLSFNYLSPNLSIFENKFKTAEEASLILNRDIVFQNSYNTLSTIKSSTSRFVQTNLYNLNELKSFYIVNTKNQFLEPHVLETECIAVQEKFTLWKPKDYGINQESINLLINNLNEIIFPRLLTLWGVWADIDNDSRIAIVLSNTLNEEGVAIGYFNPQDLFKKNTDSTSPNHNPYSNEMDVVFLAIPETDTLSNFSEQSILATAAHEITHAITFNQKTYSKLQAGNANAIQADLFLDEGWSHLSENLCGFGVSGGNIAFLNKFLQNTGNYSLCSSNINGQIDSVGMRGGICLFLSYLFWQKGGISWTEDFQIVDNEGIQFLRNMISSDFTDWTCIGKAYGKETSQLFYSFISDLNRQRCIEALYEYKVDPITEEPIEFFSNMGEFKIGNKTVIISHPVTKKSNDTFTQPQWSFQFIDEVLFFDLQSIAVTQESERADISFMKSKQK